MPERTPDYPGYWRATRLLTLTLLIVWALVTFLPAYYAAPLNRYDFLGFPLGFYLAAQGTLLAYLAIVHYYVKAMARLDLRYGVGEQSGPPS
ncbi:MAG: DUF4212 domain-containing protein [Rhodocyclaceae bacterium]|nr:DUF4212 domain-containing protein [Rhodocyclaceae bacterium]MCW5614613.1 DUF4212 domain-containing protein [Rhodocyclaceae bacterium]